MQPINRLVLDDNMEGQGLLRSDSMTSLTLNESFKSLTRKDAEKALNRELQRLLHTAPTPLKQDYEKEFEMFQRIFKRFLSEETKIHWEQIEPPSNDAILRYENLVAPTSDEQIVQLLNKVAVVKLNGGLGTSMGCYGPKSLISVRNDLTFLDLHVQQLEQLNHKFGVNIPLVLMDSFNTDEDMQKVLVKYANVKVEILRFQQTKHPRLNKETLLPIVRSLDIHTSHEGVVFSRGLWLWSPLSSREEATADVENELVIPRGQPLLIVKGIKTCKTSFLLF